MKHSLTALIAGSLLAVSFAVFAGPGAIEGVQKQPVNVSAIAMFSIWRAGCLFAPINFNFRGPQLSYQLEEPTLLTNVVGFTNIADWGFRYFEQQKGGHLINISSVGGTRGSGVAPAYNASKAYQINYMEGLRQKAAKLPFAVYTTDIRPGFIDTAMAKGEGLFWVTPVDKAVKQIKKAISDRKKVAFISKRWKYVAWLFKLIPSALYCKM